MFDYRQLREAGLQVLGEAFTPPVQLAAEIRALARALPIKGYTQWDIAAIALGMSVQQHATDDYARGYQDGIASLLLEAETPVHILSRLLERHSREAAS